MENEKQVADATEQNGAASSGHTERPAEMGAKLEVVTAQRDKLLEEKDDLHDRLLRRQAEFENFRRRMSRERSEILEFAGMESVRELLPVLDDFERALQSECSDQEYCKGMTLIYQRLLDTMQKLGLEPITTDGEKFDPHVHHALESAESEDVEENTILAEYQKGYNFKGRLVRPAMVKVAVKPQTKP